MKKLFTLVLTGLVSMGLFAQNTPPQGITYQAVAINDKGVEISGVDATGVPIPDKAIDKEVTLADGETAPIKQSPEAANAKSQELQTGFIAQEVEEAAKKLGYDFSGIDAPKNENDHYGLRYAEFTVPLVKAVQELNAKNEALNTKNEAQDALIQELLKRFEALENGRKATD